LIHSFDSSVQPMAV